jgi:dihydrolipoamide dehydrogenase
METMSYDYDLTVIGGGPGGYVAAIRGAQLGAKVLLVEKDKLGGVCLNRGCIPTKSLLQSAAKWRDLKRCGDFGLRAVNLDFDYEAVHNRADRIVGEMVQGVARLIKSNAIDFSNGTAVLEASDRLRVIDRAGAAQSYTSRRIILATGSTPLGLPVAGGNLPGVITSDDLLAMSKLPPNMMIVGAGAVGIEFATILQAFGCEVTVVEAQPSILPNVDSELVKRMGLILRKQGIKLLTDTWIVAIAEAHGGLAVQLTGNQGDRTLSVANLLVAAGRAPSVAGLGLDEVGIAYSRNGIAVDANLATNVPGIYAVGDLTGRRMLAHVASAEGSAAAENALGGVVRLDYRAVPACVYTSPELAMVGLTEAEAVRQGQKVKISKFNFAANGKAVVMGEPDGLVKLVAASDSGALLGMHVLGAHAGDLVMEGVLAIQNGLSVGAIAHTIHPHPSLSEAVLECAHGVGGAMIHQVKL